MCKLFPWESPVPMDSAESWPHCGSGCGGSRASPLKASVPGEVVIVFWSKEAYSQTQKGKLLPLARKKQGDLRVQVASFIWTQWDVSITNFRILFFPSNALLPEKLSKTVNLNDVVILQPTQLFILFYFLVWSSISAYNWEHLLELQWKLSGSQNIT